MLFIRSCKLRSSMGNGILYFIIFCLFMRHAYGFKFGFTVKRDKVEIRHGDDTCISNCSHISTNGNEPLVCSVEDCESLELSENTSQESEIEKKTVYFESYYDEIEEKQKLALHFKWSPVDNISMERTKGYVLNVSDGISSYSTCYSISTPMDFHTNAHDLFYNDCFGKVGGTEIKLGSKITVNITTLPLWVANHDDGKVKFIVEVPNCERKELHEFSECIIPGGRLTDQPCATDCNFYSEVSGTTHPVTCTLSKSTINNIAGKEQCEEVNKRENGMPSQPKHVNKTQEWYKFIDDDDNVKIALNFSWTPRLDSSLENLHGYYLEITPIKSDFTNYNKCYSVHTNLTLLQHSKTEFFHDCYGRGANKVTPGEEFVIHLNSWPRRGMEKEDFKISIPDCTDERMQDVTYCKDENGKLITGSVDEIFCHNRSMKYTYHVSPEYGDFADILFCERSEDRVCRKLLQRMQQVAPSNTLYNISLPSSANLSLNYSVFVHASKDSYERVLSKPDFSKCVRQNGGSDGTTVMIVLILIFGILCLVCIVILVCFICRRDCWTKFITKCLRKDERNRVVEIPADHEPIRLNSNPDNGRRQPVQPSSIPPRIRVYVIFMDDHKLHKEVIHFFCSYLKEDLGLDVRLNMWQEREVAANATMFMNSNLNNADKVIVICSEGTKNCLNKDEYDGDMFTPVVRNICQQAFVGHNPGKFLVGFFDYSTESHVPELLYEQCRMYFSLFKLMKQFEQFYFRLVGVEQYQDGGIQRIEKIAFDRYYDPALTKHGKELKEAIDRMKYFVEDNPTWYNDLHGSDQPQSNMLPPPVPRPPDCNLDQDRSILDPTPAGASISRLNAAPPPQLRNGATATAPKVLNNLPSNQRQLQKVPCASHRNARMYQPSSMMTSASTESSYIVTETEGLSTSPSRVDSPTEGHDENRSRFHSGHRSSSDVFDSYGPDSFQNSDFPTFEDNSADRLLSNETEITRIGLTPSMERLREANGMMYPFLNVEQEIDDDEPLSGLQAPESGPIRLANVEDVENLEEQFRSINEL